MDEWILKDKNYQKLRQIALERMLGKEVLEGKNPPKLLNTLIFDQDERKALYISQSGKHYHCKFKRKTNTYNLLNFLARNPKTVFGIDELTKQIKPNEKHNDDFGDDRLVRSTIKELRRKLKLTGNKIDDCFTVSNGYGLKCSVVLI